MGKKMKIFLITLVVLVALGAVSVGVAFADDNSQGNNINGPSVANCCQQACNGYCYGQSQGKGGPYCQGNCVNNCPGACNGNGTLNQSGGGCCGRGAPGNAGNLNSCCLPTD